MRYGETEREIVVDALVVGGGINGAAAAQHLAGAGYDVLLVEREDFGSGSTSRSSRMQGCGLNYLFAFAPGGKLWRYALHPDRAFSALKLARDAMQMRAATLRTSPERLRTFNWSYPVYDGGRYSSLQLQAGLRLLDALGPKDGKLGIRTLGADEARQAPLLGYQRDPERLLGAVSVTYVQYDWPERITVDIVLDAERLGARVLNHVGVVALARSGDGLWQAELADRLDPDAPQRTVRARVLVNTAGIWIDEVNALARSTRNGRKVAGNKGVHIAFRLPPECANEAVVNFSTGAEPFFCAPLGPLHYVGPTEEAYSSGPSDLAVTEDDIEHLRHETDQALPGIGLKRSDIVFAWSGVRPLTYAGTPGGTRGRVLHDLGPDGMPDALALTSGAIMTHRLSAKEILAAVAQRVEPRRPARAISFAPAALPDEPGSPQLMDSPPVRESDVRHAVRREHARTLDDILFRRLPVGWSETMGDRSCEAVAAVAGEALGWSVNERAEQVARHRDRIRRVFRFGGGAA